MTDETRDARRARQQSPETYASVSDWFADYRGFVPIQMAHGLQRYMDRHGCSFAEAYRALRDGGAIVEVDPAQPE